MSPFFFSGVCSIVTSALVSGALSRYHGRFALLDRPNARSLHTRAVPRSGGLGILSGIALGAFVSGQYNGLASPGWGGLAVALVALVSLADDVRHLPALVRILVHFVAAGLLVYTAGFMPKVLNVFPGIALLEPAWLMRLLCLFIVVWMVNLYNFMDGMDGFAGGMAVIGFGSFALLGALAGSPAYVAAALVVALATVGFLPFNFPPARLFMGDVGSGSLGFLAAGFMLWAERDRLFPLWMGALVFSPFIVDATWTVVRRTSEGQKPWKAHREHYYQRLVQLGWGHRRTVLWAYTLMLICTSLALAAFCFTSTGVQSGLLGLSAATYLALMAYINALERRRSSR